MKKLISTLLVLAMVFTMMPTLALISSAEGEGAIVLPGDCFHSRLSYTDNQDGETHTVTCLDCGAVINASQAHTFSNGTCTLCGATESATDPYLDPALVFQTYALSLESSIKTQFIYNHKNLSTTYSQFKVSYRHVYADDREDEVADITPTVMTAKLSMAEIATRSIDMCDNYYVTLCGYKDGQWYHGEEVTWTVRDGAMAMIRRDSSAASLKALLASMLNYGAAAQAKLGYNTTDLANSQMTAAEAALALTEPATALTNDKSETASGTALTANATALLLDSAIEMQFIYRAASTSANPADSLEAHISYVHNNETVTRVYDVTGQGRYRFISFSELRSNQMREVVSVELFDKTTGQSVSPILTYSGVTYAYEKANSESATQADKDLANALICYVDAAIAHFG